MSEEPSEEIKQPEQDLSVSDDTAPEDDNAHYEPQAPAFTWQASEYLHHDKTPMWYMVLGGITLALVVGMVVFKQWFSIPVIVVMAAALAVYGAKKPRTLNYAVDNHGITIEGKFHPFTNFRSFAVIQDVAWHMIDLEPTQRLMPRLTVLFDSDDFQPVVSQLAAQLPEVDRAPDWTERLARYLKF